MKITARDAVTAAAGQLAAAGFETARLDAEILAAHVMDIARLDMLVQSDRTMDAAEHARFQSLVTARLRGEPVAYLTGHKEFWSLDFWVTPDTLIPRPDSETLVGAVLNAVPAFRSVLDLGTGSGALLLALLHERATAAGIGVDMSVGALAVAQQNAVDLGLSARAHFVRGNWYAPVRGRRFDVIVSNPPYIRADDYAALSPGVRDYEPKDALLGPGADGLDAYRTIVLEAPHALEPGGVLAVEVGYDQAETVRALFEVADFADIEICQDLAGHSRVVMARHGEN